MLHRSLLPNMYPYIDPDRTVICTNATLHTPRGIRNYTTCSQDGMFFGITLEKVKKSHIETVVKRSEKLFVQYFLS